MRDGWETMVGMKGWRVWSCWTLEVTKGACGRWHSCRIYWTTNWRPWQWYQVVLAELVKVSWRLYFWKARDPMGAIVNISTCFSCLIWRWFSHLQGWHVRHLIPFAWRVSTCSRKPRAAQVRGDSKRLSLALASSASPWFTAVSGRKTIEKDRQGLTTIWLA